MSRTALALVPLAALALGGCQSIFGHSSRLQVTARSDIEAGDEFAAAQMAAGRAALGEGRYAAAIASFSNARGAPEHLAEALNGMAVAYAGIGRNDLAERYFRQAVAAAPGDARFARNLARLQANAQIVPVAAAAPQMAAAERAAPVVAGRPLPVRVATVRGGLTRVSATEVTLHTIAPAARPAVAAVPARAAPRSAAPANVAVRVEPRQAVAARARPPVMALRATTVMAAPASRVRFGHGTVAGTAR